MTKRGPKPLPASLRRQRMQISVEPAVIAAVQRYADAWNMRWATAARVLLIHGVRDRAPESLAESLGAE